MCVHMWWLIYIISNKICINIYIYFLFFFTVPPVPFIFPLIPPQTPEQHFLFHTNCRNQKFTRGRDPSRIVGIPVNEFKEMYIYIYMF